MKLGPHLTSLSTVSTGSPQSSVLSPLPYTFYTYDCILSHPSKFFKKFADKTTPWSGSYQEVMSVADIVVTNNLQLNTRKNMEVMVDFRRSRVDHTPLFINGDSVERVSSFKFLGVHISKDLTWSLNTMVITKRAQQKLHFQRLTA